MNRQNRRNEEREAKKKNKKSKQLESWIRSLTKDKIMLLNEFCKIENTKANKDLVAALDRGFTAAMVQMTDFSLDEINKVFEKIYELVEEDTEKVKELKRVYGGDWIMKINKMELEVRERVIQLVKEGLNQKKAVEVLSLEFNSLSKATLTNAFKKCKEEVKKENETKKRDLTDIDEAVSYIFEEDGQENNNENKGSEKVDKKITAEVKEKEIEGQVIKDKQACVQAIANNNKTSKLKIKRMEVEGENGVYEVSEEGVKLNSNGEVAEFKTVEDLEAYRKVELEKFENRIAEFREVFDMRG